MTYKLGFIGFGKMAAAIWKGVSKTGQFKESEVVFCCQHEESGAKTNAQYGIVYSDIDTVVTSSTILILAIKPQQLSSISLVLKKVNSSVLVISLLAGISINRLEKSLGADVSVIRVMPNMPAQIGHSMSVMSYSDGVSNEERNQCERLFTAIGKTMVVDEPCMDIATGISGSGPAFFYRIANQIALVGQQEGLSFNNALSLVSQTLVGAGLMLQQKGASPEALINEVASPNGTTVAGLDTFDQTGCDESIKLIIEAAIFRARELNTSL